MPRPKGVNDGPGKNERRQEQLLESLKTAIVEIDRDRAREIAQKIIAAGIDPVRQ
jgi:methanogenic corrinoid protein MtbC1